MAKPLRLRPGKALRLPSVDRAAMALAVKRPFESFGNVETLRMAGLSHGDGGGARARAGAAEEKYRGVGPGAAVAQRLFDRRRERRIARHRGKFLPLDEQRLLAERRKVGDAV